MNLVIPVIIALIENKEGKILLLKRSAQRKWAPSLWNIVSGHIEEGEEPLKTALREVEEETKLPVELKKEFPVYDIEADGRIWWTHPFLFSTTSGKPILDHEHTEFAWVLRDDLSKYDIASVARKDLQLLGYLK